MPANGSGHFVNKTMLSLRALRLQWVIFSNSKLLSVWSLGRPRRSQVKDFLDSRFCSLQEYQAAHWIGSRNLHQRAVSRDSFWRQDRSSCQSWAQMQRTCRRDSRTQSAKGETLLMPPIPYIQPVDPSKKQEKTKIKVKLPDGTNYQMVPFQAGTNEDCITKEVRN